MIDVIRISVALAVLCSVAVILRLAARWKGRASIGFDDGLMVVSLILFYSMTSCSILRMYEGAHRGDKES